MKEFSIFVNEFKLHVHIEYFIFCSSSQYIQQLCMRKSYLLTKTKSTTENNYLSKDSSIILIHNTNRINAFHENVKLMYDTMYFRGFTRTKLGFNYLFNSETNTKYYVIQKVFLYSDISRLLIFNLDFFIVTNFLK